MLSVDCAADEEDAVDGDDVTARGAHALSADAAAELPDLKRDSMLRNKPEPPPPPSLPPAAAAAAAVAGEPGAAMRLCVRLGPGL